MDQPLPSPTFRVPDLAETGIPDAASTFVLEPWPWIGILLILLSAIVSVTLIFWATRRAIRELAQAAANGMLSRTAAPAAPTALTSIGRGDVIWISGGFTVSLVRRLVDVDAGTMQRKADEEISKLLSQLSSLNIDPRDINESAPAMVGSGSAILLVSLNIRDPKLETAVSKAALAAGFTEEAGAPREEITVEDAHALAGDRAVQDALDNTTALTASLKINRDQMSMIGADLETVSIPGDDSRVVKVATTRWAHTPTAPAESAPAA